MTTLADRVDRVMQEARRAQNTVAFLGTEDAYLKAYEDHRRYVRNINLTESEPFEGNWNKVLLKVQTVGELRASDLLTREPMLLPWFRQGDACLLYAPAGLGKSFLSMAIGLAVAGGGEIKGLGWHVQDARKVMLIDGEMPMADLRDRLETITRNEWISGLDQGAADANFGLLCRLGQGDDAGFIDLTNEADHRLISRKAMADGVRLIIFDNVSTLTEGMKDENDAVSFKKLNGFISKLKRQGISVLLVHHANKEGFSFRGSSALSVTFDSIIGLHRVPTECDFGTRFRLAFEKVRAHPSQATATREITMTDLGYSTGGELEGDANLMTVVEFVKDHQGDKLSFNRAANTHIKLNRETIQKKLVIALNNGLITAQQVVGTFSHLPSPVLDAVEANIGTEF